MKFIIFTEKPDNATQLRQQSPKNVKPESMDPDSVDMLDALRRQIQPHLMMAALATAPVSQNVHGVVSSVHGPLGGGARVNFPIPLSSFMLHVSYLIRSDSLVYLKLWFYLSILYQFFRVKYSITN